GLGVGGVHRRLAVALLVLRCSGSPVDPVATPRADADGDADAEGGVLAALFLDRPVSVDAGLRMLVERGGVGGGAG
ncbi:DNA alkylation response protein, partial [Burkholderia pseudomallei]